MYTAWIVVTLIIAAIAFCAFLYNGVGFFFGEYLGGDREAAQFALIALGVVLFSWAWPLFIPLALGVMVTMLVRAALGKGTL